jgi:hypothetical protein
MKTKIRRISRTLAMVAGCMVTLTVVPLIGAQVASDGTSTEIRSPREHRGFDVGWLGLAGLAGLLGLKRRNDDVAPAIPRPA